MPEVNFSMAMFNLAMEIKPADPAGVPRPSNAEFQVRSNVPETFDRVLDRIERNTTNSARDGTSVRGPTDDSRQTSRSNDPNDSRLDDKSSPETGHEPVPEGSETESAPLNSDGVQNVENPQETSEAPAENAVSTTEVQQGETQTTGNTADSGNQAGSSNGSLPDVTMSVRTQLPIVLVPVQTEPLQGINENPVAPEPGFVNQAPDGPGTQDLTVTETGLLNILNIRMPVPGSTGGTTAPIIDLLPQVSDGSNSQTVNPDIQIGITDRQPVLPPVEPQLRIEPPVISIANSVPESQWTSMIELDTLLNPSLRANSQVSEARIPISRQVVNFEPAVRDTGPEVNPVSRNPEPPRFDWQMPEQQQAKLAGNTLIQGAKPDSSQEAIIPDSLLKFSSIIKPLVGISGIGNQISGIAETVPVGQTVNAASAQAVSGAKVLVNTEVLVSDVREAVMRIAVDGRGEARLVLHPPELGELVVRIESAKNGIVRAEFHTINPLVRDALEAGIQRLTDALKSEGLTLEHASVHLDLGPGADGQSGETDSNPSGTGLNQDTTEAAGSEFQENSNQVFERLPEGSTISVLA